MKRLFAVLLAVAVVWPQIIVPCAPKESGCAAACAKCACSTICCDSRHPTEPEPLAIPAQSIVSSAQWAVPHQEMILRPPAPDSREAIVATFNGFRTVTVPLFLRDCAQLI